MVSRVKIGNGKRAHAYYLRRVKAPSMRETTTLCKILRSSVSRMSAKLIITCRSRDLGRSARRLTISKPHKKDNKNGQNLKFIILKQTTCVV